MSRWRGASRGRALRTFDPTQLRIGAEHELEHTPDYATARRIAADHLTEDPQYYVKLARAGLGDEHRRQNPPRKCSADECHRQRAELRTTLTDELVDSANFPALMEEFGAHIGRPLTEDDVYDVFADPALRGRFDRWFRDEHYDDVARNEPTLLPPGDFLSFRGEFSDGSWFVHRTDAPDVVAGEGFRGATLYFHLTTLQRDMKWREPGEGVVFAFDVEDRVADSDIYGKHGVFFQADGAASYYHCGDEQRQVIVPAGCTYNHVAATRNGGTWWIAYEDAARGLSLPLASDVDASGEAMFAHAAEAGEWLEACVDGGEILT